MLKFPPSVWVRTSDLEQFGHTGEGWVHRAVEGRDKERRVAMAIEVEEVVEHRVAMVAKGYYVGFTKEEVQLVRLLREQAEADAFRLGHKFDEELFYQQITADYYEARKPKKPSKVEPKLEITEDNITQGDY